jgi:hypothetical protein
MGVPTDRLVWEMLVAGLRPDAGRGAASASAFGYAGGLPVAEVSETLAPEALAAASALSRLPAGTRIHLATSSPGLAAALADVSAADLPPWLRRRLMALLGARRVVVEFVGETTPRLAALLRAARAALPYARPLAEVEAWMAGARASGPMPRAERACIARCGWSGRGFGPGWRPVGTGPRKFLDLSPVSVAGGEVRIEGDTEGRTAAVLDPGQRFRVRLTSGASGETVSAVVDVGGVEATFSVASGS